MADAADPADLLAVNVALRHDLAVLRAQAQGYERRLQAARLAAHAIANSSAIVVTNWSFLRASGDLILSEEAKTVWAHVAPDIDTASDRLQRQLLELRIALDPPADGPHPPIKARR